ncbi:MAG TPA: crotonase/enoyl-CoA hydratase family protein [Polyangiaceae bacterium]|jgi:enoyl-CoA hydratase/carnithine racemase|nr:crotonase/enoyl-CoA hydratase family protein [Polyangiaceae bacterium]
MAERVTIQIDHGVADVRLNRPEKRNALDAEMFEALIDAGKRLAVDSSVRAVVLSGEGLGFCAGLDFKSFLGGSGGDLLAREAGSLANRAQRAAYVWQEVPVPVIAAIHGVAFGGGLQIALGADMRFATPDAQLSVMEIRWGLVPDMSGTQTLRHLVRLDVAKDLTFTGRIVSGKEAAELGLVTRVVESPREAALVTAREIAKRSPHAIRADKQLLNAADLVSVAEGLALEEKLQREMLGSPNQIEAVMANMEKRAPVFQDP